MHQADAAFWKGIVVGVMVAVLLQTVYLKFLKVESKSDHKIKIDEAPKGSMRKSQVLEKMKGKYENDKTREKLEKKYGKDDWSMEKDQEYYSKVYDMKVEELQGCTVAELKSLCKEWKLMSGGLKDDLIHRLAEFECERKESISRMLAS